MACKRSLLISLLLAVAGGFFAYFLGWGLFTTHPELGRERDSARVFAFCIAPLIFVASLIYFSRKHTR
jgi:hypothetical protein